VAGQTVIGLGNASLDLQSMFEDLSVVGGLDVKVPFQFAYVRGTVDPINPLTYLMQFRDAELRLRKPIELGFSQDVCSDPPAWWNLKKKKTRGWTGALDARSARVDMVNLLNPFNGAEYIKKQEQPFADIAAFLLTIEAPKYPFPVDEGRAEQGRLVFAEHCAKCHGRYGPGGGYPNKVVAFDTLGTDRTLAESLSPKLVDHYNQSWFAREVGPDGKPYHILDSEGYQAPPLDGVWATAPYFHNGSVPTIYGVLNSKARPKVYTRSYRTDKEDYDPVHLGWKVTVLDGPPDAKLSAYERRKVYDTTQRGRSNGGHTFGDKLTEDERLAVVEYLKTL
jgi:mono/diheme cytochrome c family protein